MVDTKAMGFTNGWEQEPLWRKSSNERGCVKTMHPLFL